MLDFDLIHNTHANSILLSWKSCAIFTPLNLLPFEAWHQRQIFWRKKAIHFTTKIFKFCLPKSTINKIESHWQLGTVGAIYIYIEQRVKILLIKGAYSLKEHTVHAGWSFPVESEVLLASLFYGWKSKAWRVLTVGDGIRLHTQETSCQNLLALTIILHCPPFWDGQRHTQAI